MNCKECSIEFEGKSFRIFCSRSCSVTFNNRKFKRVYEQKFCKNCNIEISSSKTYCSHKCCQQYKRNSKIQSNLASAQTLRKFLIDNQNWCFICLISEWCGKPIGLELDHIDGHSENNTIENVRLLCPNCHSQTPTFKNKNKGNGRKQRLKRYHNNK